MFKDNDDIRNHCCNAWNSLISRLWRNTDLSIETPILDARAEFDRMRGRERDEDVFPDVASSDDGALTHWRLGGALGA